ncbi:MAG: ABC transporter permease subunit [Wenzhouxiangellaceae bacterium]|nr:ABC transporter permease subunit [Wenzhouxiangellaceae bacterium]
MTELSRRLASNSSLPSREQMSRRRRWRHFADRAAGLVVRSGGGGVVIALALIFVYLFSEVVPLLRGASVERVASYVAPAGGEGALLALERYDELGMRYDPAGRLDYFRLADGQLLESLQLQVPEAVEVTAMAVGEPRARRAIFGLSDGRALIVDHGIRLSFSGDRREVVPDPAFPLGREPVLVDPLGQPLVTVALQRSGDDTGVAALTEDGRLLFVRYQTTTSFLTGETEVRERRFELPAQGFRPEKLQLAANLWTLIGAERRGTLLYWDLSDPARAELRDRAEPLEEGERITELKMLNGTFSWVIGTSRGRISQWFLVRDQSDNAGSNMFRIKQVREFRQHDGAITRIQPEYNRKGFAAVDDAGGLGLHFGTSARTLYLDAVAEEPLVAVGISPVDDKLVVETRSGELLQFDVWNQHPEYSLRALWGKVWYEGRQDPEYVWQASSGADSFEPKYSMVPLTIGTLKAALFAMLFAMPLAIAGAIYTAYFMAPRLRGYVKPTIEVMEALPTVILGFLAGLWLAPFLENHIPAVFSVLLGLPLAMLLAAWLFTLLPLAWRRSIPPGWEAVMLMPVIVLTVWSLVSLSPLIEIWFFDGSMRQWFTDIGITYDQRNALVVGIAMGFAVIPTIFSIAEDAVFTVPRHLTQGSLALGATPWQTVTRVVLLTASPGIFSAVMIGFGRAVGETMIVLMATGNSPVVNFNLFEGMRTLSANIAVELPETAVDSTHYRILFLAGLVLFALTFLVNTVAELVRQRLRQRYSSL